MRRAPHILLLFAVSLVFLGASLADGGEAASPGPAALPPSPQAEQAPLEAAPEPVAVDDPEPEVAEVEDPYVGWQAWCEPLDYETKCESHDDCAKINHVGTRPQRCVHPWWAKWDKGYKVCAPGEVMRSERVWRDARIREIVARLYFDEAGHCPAWSWTPMGRESADGRVRYPKRYQRTWSNGRATWEQHWRCTQHTAPAARLAAYLGVVYGRETSRRPWKRHRLNPDVNANRDSWVTQAAAYGWEVELVCENGKKKCKKKQQVVSNYWPDPEADEYNEHYGDRWRWQYGLGGYGKNSALGAQDWDPMAPPEVLCLEVQGTEAYLRDARTAVRKYTSERPPTCNDQPYRGLSLVQVLDEFGEVVEELEREVPSWRDVHRVASGGKWCPRFGNGERRRKFDKRMARAGLRPDAPVSIEDLGQPILRETQNAVAAAARAELDAILPPHWRG